MAFLQKNRTDLSFCRLCLIEIHDRNDTLLQGIIKDMLEIILPELNLSICEAPTSVCKSCLESLKQSYNFKSSCLEVEDKVQEFVNPKKPSLIDLKEVLRHTSDIKHIVENLIVCRTCLGLGQESLYTKLGSYEGDPLQNMVEKCLPEMGLDLTKDPSICPTCLEQLEEQFHFIMQCLDTEAKINYYSERKRVFKDVDLQNVYLFSICMEETDDVEKQQYGTPESLGNGNCCHNIRRGKMEETPMKNNLKGIKKENSDEDFVVDLTENPFPAHIKNKFEELDHNIIVSDNNKPKSKLLLKTSEEEVHEPTQEILTFQLGKDNMNGEDIVTSQMSRIIPEINGGSDSDVSVTKESDVLAVKKVTNTERASKRSRPKDLQPIKPKPKYDYKDDDGDKSEEEFNKRRLITRKCKLCVFKTKFPSRMKAHMTVNHPKKLTDEAQPPQQKQPQRKLEEKVFKCRQCPFKTPDEGEYKPHKLQHRKDKEQKCPECDMVFVRPDFLRKHIETHAGALKTNNANAFRKLSNIVAPKRSRPVVKHPPPPPTTDFNMVKPKIMKNMFSFHGQMLKMFKCRLCPYQTRLKSNYDKHGLTHKKTSEIKTHRCKLCNFETIQKENFLSHMQSHDNEGENKVMKCFLCSFQPATEAALRQHVNQVHKSGTG